MATYKVLQDIEAEDKLVGPLTLWQFIYALGAGLCLYLSAVAIMKSVPYFLIILVPVALFVGFLAVPWGGDQPTEVWALAKLRFFLKPRLRIWDQSGMTELVTVTAPKHEERVFTDGLSQREVKSRLHALANTLDSRGWAVKNVNVNLATTLSDYSASDRLVDVSTTPQEVTNVDIRPDDDILDEQANPVAQTFSTMINQAANLYRKTLLDRMNQPLPQVPNTPPSAASTTPAQTVPLVMAPQDVPTSASLPFAPGPAADNGSQQPPANWFMQPPATDPITATPTTPTGLGLGAPVQTPIWAAEPTAFEAALLKHGAEENQQSAAYGHLKTLKTPEQLEEEARKSAAAKREKEQREATAATATDAVTSEKQAAIMNLSRSNDLNIDTLARQAKQTISDDNEVVISLR